MLDVLIKNANIIDVTGKPAYKGSIGNISGSMPGGTTLSDNKRRAS